MLDIDRLRSLSDIKTLLQGNDAMDKLIYSKNWSETILGSFETWPQSLQTALSIVLSSKLPMALCWGPQLLFFYNDAYRPFIKIRGEDSINIGMPVEKVMGKQWQIVQPFISRVVQEGISISDQSRQIEINNDGKFADFYCTLTYTPVNDESKKPGGVFIICTDITTLLPLKTSLNHIAPLPVSSTETNDEISILNNFNGFEKNFRRAIMQAPIGVAILQGVLLEGKMANEIWLKIIGKTEEEFIGKSLFASLPELEESMKSILLNVLATGEPFSIVEFPVTVYRNNEIRKSYFNINYQALKNDEDVILGIMILCTDVSPLVKVKYTLAESEKRFRNMVIQSPIAMAILRGKNFTIEIANPAMVKNIWQREEKDVLGKNLMEIFPEYLAKNIELLALVYVSRKIVKQSEVVANLSVAAEVKILYFDYEFAPLFEQDGTVSGIMVTANDVTKKVEARQQIETEEARLRLATEASGFATWDLDFKTEKLVHSSMLAEIFGFAPSVLLTYQDMYNQIHPDDQHIVAAIAFEEAMLKSIYACEYRITRPDKTMRWIRTQGKIIYNKNQEPLRLIGTLLDITDKKIIEEEIISVAAIVASSEDAIISKNQEGIITTWNKAAEKMFGYSAVEIIGQPLLILTPNDCIEKEEDIINQIEKGKGVYTFETRRLKKDNSLLDVSLTISKIKDAQGNVIGMSKIARDITVQKKIEKEIAVSEAKFRLLANSMAQFIWTSDTKGSLNYFNDSVYNYADKTSEDLENDGWLSIVHPDDRAGNIIQWKKSIATGNDFIVEHRFRRSDGEYRWQLSRAIPQKDSFGKIQMWVGTSTDIHEIKENEQQKDFFISMASHELKTPVTTIKGYVQILMSMYNEKGDAVLKNSLEVVNKQILTLTSLITDLLDLSKIKSGSLQLNKEHFCINDLIGEIVQEIRLTEPASIIEFEKVAHTMVFADRGRIGQVLINFLTNAIKYSPNNNKVEVTIAIVEKEALVTVTDFGIGISKANQQKIFQRFYRVSGKDEKTFPGFGIGLFIAAEIIQRHQGKIGVESAPGKGSVFYFSLPINN